MLFRSIGLFGLQIHPLRPRQRGVALFVPKGPREQGRVEENQKGETSLGHGNFTTHPHRQMVLHPERRLHPRLDRCIFFLFFQIGYLKKKSFKIFI